MAHLTYQRVGAISLILGVIAFVVFVSLLPVEPNEVFDDHEKTLQKIVDDDALWLSSHVVAMIAVPLIVVGLCALSRSIATQPAHEWSRAALISVLVGMALFFVLIGLNGFGIKGVAEAWADAPEAEKAAALRIFEAIEAVNMGVWGLTLLGLFGVPIVLYGVAVSMSDDYPRWLGLVGVVFGLGMTVLGIAISFAAAAGESTEDFDWLFPFIALTRIHRRTALGTALEEASGCSSESGIMVLEQKPARKQGAPNRCCHRTNPTVSASSLTTIAWWPMPACSCRPP